MRRGYAGMRYNIPGLIAWTLFMVGLAFGGIWIVRLGTPDDTSAIASGIVGLVCLVGSAALLLYTRGRIGQDPLEPPVTPSEEDAYVARRRAKHE